MLINELFDGRLPGYRTEKEDNSAVRLSDIRKTRLTLAQINRLRQANDIRRFEHEQKLKQVSKQYKAPVEAGGMPGL